MTDLEQRLTAALDRYADLAASAVAVGEELHVQRRIRRASRRVLAAVTAPLVLVAGGVALGLVLTSSGVRSGLGTVNGQRETLAVFPGLNLKLVTAPADARPVLSASGAYLPYARAGHLPYRQIPTWLHHRLAILQRSGTGLAAGGVPPTAAGLGLQRLLCLHGELRDT